MGGAVGVLAVNIGTAMLFAAGYAAFAFSNRSHRAAIGFSISYLIGMFSPICDLMVSTVRPPELVEWLSYASFLAATLSMSVTFSLYHQRRPAWAAVTAVFVLGMTLRFAIGMAPQNTLAYGMAYQLPFALAAAQATTAVLKVDRRGPLHVALATLFALTGVSFLVKPFLAVALGEGRTLVDYVRTTYALFSQASTGILLLAAGVLLLLIVAQKAILESQQASETDPLSGLANRRGFDRLAQLAIARALPARRTIAVAVFDLDHFKQINDTFGHAVGDEVIGAFAQRLRTLAPGGAVIGRLGGEEFAVLLPSVTVGSIWRCAEMIRQGSGRPDVPAFTVSGGVAQLRAGESLAELMRRADQAAYAAKTGGRDQICYAGGDHEGAPAVVVPLRKLAHGHAKSVTDAG